MKLRTLIHGTAALVLILGGLTSRAESEDPISTKDTMKLKLHYAQRVLEGIATENYEVLSDSANRLRNLSGRAAWKVRATPEYGRLTADFSRNAGALVKAAKEENVDAATVAYFQMTVSCTTCHRYLRGERGLGLAPDKAPEFELAAGTNNNKEKN